MVNIGDVFVSVVVGLAMPLAMLDGYRALLHGAMPEQAEGLHLERRASVWLLAIMFGPGLFMERMLGAWREGRLAVADGVNAFVITLAWAGLYGFLVLSLVKTLLPI